MAGFDGGGLGVCGGGAESCDVLLAAEAAFRGIRKGGDIWISILLSSDSHWTNELRLCQTTDVTQGVQGSEITDSDNKL